MHRPSRSRCKQARGGCPGPAPVTGRIRRELGLDGGPGLGLDQRLVLSRVKVAFMRYAAEIDGVGQDPVEVAARKRSAAPYARPALVSHRLVVQPRRSIASLSSRTQPSSKYRAKIRRTVSASAGLTISLRSRTS